ncbi:MAG: Chromosome-partitioning protein Spo0J [Firmicutes bacterium ADurb.Bin193]|nr:MAG: Chromosome-partitioning protein Spo0J [Firmicutes bacterium ADurb.Bin193]
MSKRVLGKGLGALLGDIQTAEEIGSANVIELKISSVEPNKNQPRKMFDDEKLEILADSIKKHGVIQPILVKDMGNGYYQIIAGERRWRASRKAGLKTIPAIVRSYDELAAMEVALIENLQREDLNPLEEAQGYKALLETFAMTQEKVAEHVGRSRSAIANSLRLLGLPPSIQKLLADGTVSSGHARAVLSVENEKNQLILVEKIVQNGLNVRQAETLAKSFTKEKARQNKALNAKTEFDHQLDSLQAEMSSLLGTKVKILNGVKKGKIEIEYYGPEDLGRLLNILKM